MLAHSRSVGCVLGEYQSHQVFGMSMHECCTKYYTGMHSCLTHHCLCSLEKVLHVSLSAPKQDLARDHQTVLPGVLHSKPTACFDDTFMRQNSWRAEYVCVRENT